MIKYKSEKGLTLIEVMIAMTVLLIGMLGVMAMQYYAISGNAVSRELRTGTNLSYEIIEQMKGTPYGSLATNTDSPPMGQAITGSMQTNPPVSRVWWVVPNCSSLGAGGGTCAAAPAPPCATVPDAAVATPDVSAIRARTCWTDSNGTFHSISLDTLRFNEG